MPIFMLKIVFFSSLVPDDAPGNVRVSGDTPSSVFVSWIPPSIPNGVITAYNVYINHSDGSPGMLMQSISAATNYTVAGLQPYEQVSVRISASTATGEGPISDTVTGRSRELGACES